MSEGAESRPACLICSSNRTHFLLDQPTAPYFARRIFRCDDCLGAFVFPQPSLETLHRIYSAETYFREHRGATHRNPGEERARLRIPLLEHLLVDSGRPRRPPKVLEIGPGNGEFLLAARQRGWQVEGLELSEEWAQTLSSRVQVPVFAADSLTALPSDAPYDVIAMWEVIEHYRDPLRELRAAFERLSPGGILAISTPNFGSFRARVYRERWRGFYEGWEHLFFFSSRSLALLLKSAGFGHTRFLSRKINSFLLKPLEYFGMGNVLEAYARKNSLPVEDTNEP